MLGLATPTHREFDYEPSIEGRIPEGLRGTLYRNGPGLFGRDNVRKQSLLDGDGHVHAFHIGKGSVRYVSRFVRTEKYIEESRIGKYRYATWSTREPGGMWANLGGGEIGNQAGVTVVSRNGKLFAFDEFRTPYELDPETLETVGLSLLGLPRKKAFFSAHSKIDPKTGEWFFFNLEYGRQPSLNLITIDRSGRQKKYQNHQLSHHLYIHDFFVSERYIIFYLHPVEISLWGYLFGLNSLIEAMEWHPEKGGKILVFDRYENNEPLQLDTEAFWMWHSLNAFEDRGEVIADFIGYRN